MVDLNVRRDMSRNSSELSEAIRRGESVPDLVASITENLKVPQRLKGSVS